MKIDKLSLPHPVLGLGDDIAGDFRSDMDVKMGREEITINITNYIENSYIEEMVDKGIAKFCVDVNCKKTLFRKTYLVSAMRHSIRIPSNALRDKVSVSFYLVATADTKEYAPTNSNRDYEDQRFHLQSGDVIGYGGEAEFVALKKWEDQRGISSFLVIRPGEHKSGPYTADLNSEKVVVFLCKEDYAAFRLASESGFDDIFLSSIVLPVVVYSLNQMLENSEHYKDYQWYQMLEFRIKNDKMLSGLEFESVNIPKIAQLLLASPLSRTLMKLNSLIDNSFDVD